MSSKRLSIGCRTLHEEEIKEGRVLRYPIERNVWNDVRSSGTRSSALNRLSGRTLQNSLAMFRGTVVPVLLVLLVTALAGLFVFARQIWSGVERLGVPLQPPSVGVGVGVGVGDGVGDSDAAGVEDGKRVRSGGGSSVGRHDPFRVSDPTWYGGVFVEPPHPSVSTGGTDDDDGAESAVPNKDNVGYIQ